jgi:ATP-dependent DNA ligase
VAAVAALKAKHFVLDSEIVVPRGQAFSFDDLLQRIHPAESRVKRLAAETPALLIVFDLLAGDNGKSFTKLTLADRRELLEGFVRKYLRGHKTIRLSPVTAKIADAQKWLKQVGTSLDGIIAKRRDVPYESGNRHGMQKIKNYRSADCVVGGFRYKEGRHTVGSFLLGLYDERGLLNHVGFTSSLRSDEKKAITAKLEKLIAAPGFTGNKPGAPSRWSTKRSAEWKPLKPRLVVEVCYEHFSDGRFRHGTRLIRWRPDKTPRPRQCTMDQVHQKKADLMKLLK